MSAPAALSLLGFNLDPHLHSAYWSSQHNAMQRQLLTGAEALSLMKNGRKNQERDVESQQIDKRRWHQTTWQLHCSRTFSGMSPSRLLCPDSSLRPNGSLIVLKPPHPVVEEALQGSADLALLPYNDERYRSKWVSITHVVDTGLEGLKAYTKLEGKLLKQVELAMRLLELPGHVMADDVRAKYVAFVQWATG
ncbi:hypothetical protein K466DRAFT_605122 [Polyporus arcularius HHB13444]|uniref:Uncharacterized protein n=1 Tax=Polyporus arcularius HHB13444 TaxID=1314778 RepID=A0A5C3NTM5_9APHY|nr:hypothetical protein K466DRAFT_605122 [Polyporus arcularius HHB13444]